MNDSIITQPLLGQPNRWTARLGQWAKGYPHTTVAIVMALSTLFVWTPFLGDISVLGRYWDGPHYMYIAKTFYEVPPDHPFQPYGLPATYFASHLPAYPALIRVMTWLTFGHYPAAMLLATLLSSVGAALIFYRLMIATGAVASPLWTSLLFCVLPPRWMIYHSVGASEPLSTCFMLGAFLAYARRSVLAVVVCIALASWTRITGVLLIPVFAVTYLVQHRWRDLATLPLAGLGIISLFGLYAARYGDFWIYFTWNQGNLGMLRPLPLANFYSYVSTGLFQTAELLIASLIIYSVGTARLWPRREMFIHSVVFLIFYSFVASDAPLSLDLPRFYLVLTPFVLLVAYDDILTSKAFRFVLPLAILLTYIYAWGALPTNLVDERVYERLLSALQGGR